jgi:hypothetical protein
MSLNWKLILGGGLAWFVATWLVSFATGPLIHDGVLKETYQATASFWRPELMEEPPNMAALLPRWITAGLIGSFLTALVYGWVRPALTGAGWMRGIKFGVIVFILFLVATLGWSGVFNLPDKVWGWWTLESIIYLLAGGAALGWAAEKLAPLTGERLAAHAAKA